MYGVPSKPRPQKRLQVNLGAPPTPQTLKAVRSQLSSECASHRPFQWRLHPQRSGGTRLISRYTLTAQRHDGLGTTACRLLHDRQVISLHNDSPKLLFIVPVVSLILSITQLERKHTFCRRQSGRRRTNSSDSESPINHLSPIERHTSQQVSCPPWPTLPAAAERRLSN